MATANKSTKAKKTTTRKQETAAGLQINMALTAEIELDNLSEGATIDALLADLDGDDEILETVETLTDDAEVVAETKTVFEVMAAVEPTIEALVLPISEEHDMKELAELDAELGKADAITALYAGEEGTGLAVSEADAPKTEEVVEPAAAAPVKKVKAPKEPKPLRATSVTHQPGDLLLVKLGDNAKDFLVFEVADAMLDSEELKAKTDAFIAKMNDSHAIADKVREKAIQLFTWMKTGGKLNEVLARAFTVLAKDGELTSGAKGNLQTNLLSKPYSPGTAASQANQVFMLFPELHVTMKEKGRMVINPESLIFMKAKAELGLG